MQINVKLNVNLLSLPGLFVAENVNEAVFAGLSGKPEYGIANNSK